ncbi:MAG: hypothetical protein AAF571_14685 [Verrucomicrobiota bacterium]
MIRYFPMLPDWLEFAAYIQKLGHQPRRGKRRNGYFSELAKEAGMSRQQLSQALRAKQPRYKTVVRIWNAYATMRVKWPHYYYQERLEGFPIYNQYSIAFKGGKKGAPRGHNYAAKYYQAKFW